MTANKSAIKSCAKESFCDECPFKIDTILNTRINGIERAIADLDRLINQSLTDLDKRFVTSVSAVEHSTQLINEALEKRLDTMNEFRLALSDQAKTFYSMPQHEIYAKSVEADLRMLRESKAELAGKADQSSVYYAYACSLIAAVLGLFSLFEHFVK